MMKALVLEGKNEPLRFMELTDPVATEGETVVAIRAAALNHRDVWIQKGLYAGLKFPIVLGSDGAGIDETGRNVIINPGINWGDNPRFQSPDYEILGLPRNGTFAQKVVVPTTQLVEMPLHLTHSEAAALPLAGQTAWRALKTKCAAKKGERVLITGIGGGVALFALQFAVAFGCEVWVTSGSMDKIGKAVTHGAMGGVSYREDGWAKQLVQKAGFFDVIIDSAGGDGFGELVKVCAPGARICFYGGTNGAIGKVSPQIVFYKQIAIFGSTMASPKEFADMIRFVNRRKLRPIIDSNFDLKDGERAMQLMDSGGQFGKIVLTA